MAGAPPLTEALRDRYVIERELGRGGMATVYLALDLKHGRSVALKVLRPELAESLGPERFRREIATAARLQHPHILSVHDSGETAGYLWFTMPYVRGESLRDHLRRDGRLSLSEALRITAETGRALDYAHREGVIHRDIKPENILLSTDGDTLVADFGIARALEVSGDARLTDTGLALGTPAYMAPEQATGEQVVDARVDQYALAATCYEMLAGRPPFDGPSGAAVIAQRFTAPVPSVRAARPEVPAGLDEALRRALDLSPAKRFESIAELIRALTRDPIVGTPADDTVLSGAAQRRPLRSRSFLRPMPALWAGIAVALVLTIALVLWGRTATSRAPPIVAAAAAMPRLAVLPFENLGDSADAYFADGVTDEITTRLAGVPGLGVISRRSAMQYKATAKPLAQIGSELGIAYVLEGTVRWDRARAQGGRVRVTPQLIQIKGDRQVWAKSFDVNLSDVFGIQDQIAGEVTRALDVALLPPQRAAQAATKTADLAAYDAYLRGNAAFFQIATTGGNVAVADTAIAAYREAVRIDPGFALAWARLAQAISILLAGAPTSPEANPRVAREAAQRAIALAPELAEAQLALSAVSGGKASKEALKRAYAASPTDPQVLQVLARRTSEAAPGEYDVLVFRDIDSSDGRWRCRSALQLLQRAAVLDPRSIPILRGLSGAYACLGDIGLAESALDRAIDVAPSLAEQWQFKAGLRLQAGDLAGARSVLQEAKRHVPREMLIAYMGAINDQYWVLDDSDQRFLLRLRPTAFGGDSMGWALAIAHTAALRADSVTARAYADTVLTVIRGRPDVELGVYEAMALAYLRRRDEALAALRRAAPTDLVQSNAGWAYVQLQAVRTYTILGARDRAAEAFQEFVQRTGERLPLSPSWRLDPIVRPLAGHQRFEALFQR